MSRAKEAKQKSKLLKYESENTVFKDRECTVGLGEKKSVQNIKYKEIFSSYYRLRLNDAVLCTQHQGYDATIL